MRKPGRSLLIVASMVLGALPSAARAEAGKPKEEKVEGYAEWRRDGCLLVDAQRVCVTPPRSSKERAGR
jgi:hypothetical protein